MHPTLSWWHFAATLVQFIFLFALSSQKDVIWIIAVTVSFIYLAVIAAYFCNSRIYTNAERRNHHGKGFRFLEFSVHAICCGVFILVQAVAVSNRQFIRTQTYVSLTAAYGFTLFAYCYGFDLRFITVPPKLPGYKFVSGLYTKAIIARAGWLIPQVIGLVIPVIYDVKPPPVLYTIFAVEVFSTMVFSAICYLFYDKGLEWQNPDVDSEQHLSTLLGFFQCFSLFQAFDLVLKIFGLNWAFFTYSTDDHVTNILRTILFVEHAVYLFIMALALLLMMIIRRQELDDLVYFMSVSYHIDADELKWRFSIASHPATLVMMPSILHFVLASIPIAVALAIHVQYVLACEYIVVLLLATFWLGFIAVFLSFVTFIAEMVCSERLRPIAQFDTYYLGVITVYQGFVLVSLCATCKGDIAGGIVAVGIISCLLFWIVLTFWSKFMLRLLQSSEAEGELWEIIGVHPHYFSAQSVLAASREAAKLFNIWYIPLLIYLIIATVAVVLRAQEQQIASFLPLQLVTIFIAVIVEFTGVIAVATVRLGKPYTARFLGRKVFLVEVMYAGVLSLLFVFLVLAVIATIIIGVATGKSTESDLAFGIASFLHLLVYGWVARKHRGTADKRRRLLTDAKRAWVQAQITPTVPRSRRLPNLRLLSVDPNAVRPNSDVHVPLWVRRQTTVEGRIVWIEADELRKKQARRSQLIDAQADLVRVARAPERLAGGFLPRLRSDGTLTWEDDMQRFQATDLAQNLPHINTRDLAAVASRSFRYKVDWFHRQVNRLKLPFESGHQRFVLSREHTLQEAFSRFSEMSEEELHQTFRYEFMGEEGVDAGGVAREFWECMSTEIFGADPGLFRCSTSGNFTYYINSDAGFHIPDAAKWFRFVGRFLGKALLDSQVLGAHLARPLYKHILGLSVSFKDLEFLDRELYENLLWLYENNSVEALDLDFTVTDETPEGPLTRDLVPAGSTILVDDTNKHDYILLMFRHRMLDSVSEYLNEFLRGIYEVIPLGLLSVFDFQEIELLSCGVEEINVEDWRSHTIYLGFFRPNHRVVRWFWNCIEQLSQEDRSRFLQFTTGTSRVPVGGFANLQGNDGEIRWFTLYSIGMTANAYPRAHTCFNRIDLPLYQSQAQLQQAVRDVIQLEVTGFSIE